MTQQSGRGVDKGEEGNKNGAEEKKCVAERKRYTFEKVYKRRD